MGLGTARTKLHYPPGTDTPTKKLQCVYSVYEALRRKHNAAAPPQAEMDAHEVALKNAQTREAYDALNAAWLARPEFAPPVIAFRRRCIDAMTLCLGDGRAVRKQVNTPGWVVDPDAPQMDPLRAAAIAQGQKDHATVDIKAITGIDVDKVGG